MSIVAPPRDGVDAGDALGALGTTGATPGDARAGGAGDGVVVRAPRPLSTADDARAALVAVAVAPAPVPAPVPRAGDSCGALASDAAIGAAVAASSLRTRRRGSQNVATFCRFMPAHTVRASSAAPASAPMTTPAVAPPDRPDDEPPRAAADEPGGAVIAGAADRLNTPDMPAEASAAVKGLMPVTGSGVSMAATPADTAEASPPAGTAKVMLSADEPMPSGPAAVDASTTSTPSRPAVRGVHNEVGRSAYVVSTRLWRCSGGGAAAARRMRAPLDAAGAGGATVVSMSPSVTPVM